MHITLVEPFFTGSHRQWALGLQKHSKHEVQLLTLPGRFWKWRMYGGAVELAQQFLNTVKKTDLILATDMLDLSTFLALTKSRTANLPVALYFHENQITYPWSDTDQDVKLQRHNQYGFINYTSALSADRLLFNSLYHQKSFLGSLPDFLKQFPDFRTLQLVPELAQKSQVLPLALDLQQLNVDHLGKKEAQPLILWNHRWEYDKGPDAFFEALFQLKSEGVSFRLLVLGEAYTKAPAIFKTAQQELSNEIIHFGYVEDDAQYKSYLHQADILLVTSHQDFFGGSVVEAMYCNTFPILPDRLAYPEHLPESEKTLYFYKEEKDLYPLLKKAVLEIEATRHWANQLSDKVAHYDWRSQIDHYDRVVETVKGSYFKK
ncbi:MAG: DUF3524 domain-containing protein [Bacteroidota bacterium]